MAVLDDTARQAIRDAFMRARNIGAVTKPDLRAAIDATDSWIDTNAASFNTALPDPFKSTATLEQKTMLFCYVALKRAGILPENGV
jgi:hypothetical protein